MIRLSKSIISQQEADAVVKILLEDGYLGMGLEVEKFERELADYLNVPADQVVCVNTGTSALHLAVESILQPGDEVLVPSLTFLSSYQAISASGMIPISCEVYKDTLTIDLEDASKRISPKTKAIMAVHYASNPANIEALYLFAKKYNLRIIEDAAHAFGCEYNNKKIGSFGDIICFSFDGIKNITSGEGGAIVTSDKKVLSFVKDGRLLSIEKDSEKRYLGQRSWDFDVKRQGYRYHMSNIFAAIGRIQLLKFEKEFAPKRIALANKYFDLLKSNQFIKFQYIANNVKVIPHILSVRILSGRRDELRLKLEQSGIPTGIHYKPNHLLSYYSKLDEALPITESLYKELLTLPLHPEISIDEVEKICTLVNTYLK
jgi:dTDP-4-amino-4,6-dideoxygalactose transaminase